MLEVIAKDWRTWLGSKIVIGFATGLMQSTVTTVVTELAPRELRGIALSWFNLSMNIGGLLATIIPWKTNQVYGGDIMDERSFRVPLYCALASPTISLILQIFLLPESPWYYMLKGRREDARKSLLFVNGKSPNFDVDQALLELEYTLQKEQELAEKAADKTYLDCFKGTDLRRTFCAVFPALTQNLTGQNLAGTVSSSHYDHE